VRHRFFLTAISVTLVVTASCGDSGPKLNCEPDLTVFLRSDISAAQRARLDELIRATEEVKWVDFESRQEAYERFRENFKDHPELVENLDLDAVPASFRIELHDPSTSPAVEGRLAPEHGIDLIRAARSVPDTSDLPELLQQLLEGMPEPC
jgi:cell division protein FtsX